VNGAGRRVIKVSDGDRQALKRIARAWSFQVTVERARIVLASESSTTEQIAARMGARSGR
jgi:hypothetical protein